MENTFPIPFHRFCCYCGHTIPDTSKLGGTVFGTLADFRTGALEPIVMTACTECLEAQSTYCSGGYEAAVIREQDDIRINTVNAKKRGL